MGHAAECSAELSRGPIACGGGGAQAGTPAPASMPAWGHWYVVCRYFPPPFSIRTGWTSWGGKSHKKMVPTLRNTHYFIGSVRKCGSILGIIFEGVYNTQIFCHLGVDFSRPNDVPGGVWVRVYVTGAGHSTMPAQTSTLVLTGMHHQRQSSRHMKRCGTCPLRCTQQCYAPQSGPRRLHGLARPGTAAADKVVPLPGRPCHNRYANLTPGQCNRPAVQHNQQRRAQGWGQQNASVVSRRRPHHRPDVGQEDGRGRQLRLRHPRRRQRGSRSGCSRGKPARARTSSTH